MMQKDTAPHLLILGYGNVARAFLPLLASRCAWLEQKFGQGPVISGIGSRSTGFFIHPTGLAAVSLLDEEDPLQRLQTTGSRCDDAVNFIQGGRAVGATVLIELTTMNPESGEPALSHIHQALEAGMDVITANKGPIAHALEQLQTLARQQHVQLRFESTVMDGLPIFNLAEFVLPAVGMRGFRGLLNSTSSLVLSQMEQGCSLAEGIGLAQQMGVAEANPWHDLDGWDAVLKTTILANVLLHAHLAPPLIERTGIRELAQSEMLAAAQAGAPIRLVSSAHIIDGVPVASVRPERLHPSDALYAGRDVGVISLETEAMDTITLTQHSMHIRQTAYGVLSDLIAMQRLR